MLGEGQVKIELFSGNFLVLGGVYHISNIRKNLITTSLLVQQGYKLFLSPIELLLLDMMILLVKVTFMM